METLEQVKRVEYVYDDVELNKLIKDFLSEVDDFIANSDYRVSDDCANALKQMKGISWTNYFQNASKRTKKKINKYIFRFRQRKSLQNANRIFHFIHTRILSKLEKVTVSHRWGGVFTSTKEVSPDFIIKIKILQPAKHLAIQEKRKKWKEARDIADKLLAEYKEEKGNYYKNR